MMKTTHVFVCPSSLLRSIPPKRPRGKRPVKPNPLKPEKSLFRLLSEGLRTKSIANLANGIP